MLWSCHHAKGDPVPDWNSRKTQRTANLESHGTQKRRFHTWDILSLARILPSCKAWIWCSTLTSERSPANATNMRLQIGIRITCFNYYFNVLAIFQKLYCGFCHPWSFPDRLPHGYCITNVPTFLCWSCFLGQPPSLCPQLFSDHDLSYLIALLLVILRLAFSILAKKKLLALRHIVQPYYTNIIQAANGNGNGYVKATHLIPPGRP